MTIPVHDKRSRIVVYPFYNGNTRISRRLWTIRTLYDLQANVSRLNRFILPCNYTFLSRILVADVETFLKHRTYVYMCFLPTRNQEDNLELDTPTASSLSNVHGNGLTSALCTFCTSWCGCECSRSCTWVLIQLFILVKYK